MKIERTAPCGRSSLFYFVLRLLKQAGLRIAGGKRGRFLRRVREDELPSRVKEAGLGHDSVPASQGASFHRGFRRLRTATYFAHGGKVGKTPPGTAPDEHFVLIVAFPRTPIYGGYPLK